MIRFIKRWFAIQSYVWVLSQELARRFGSKPYYSVEHVSKAAGSKKLNMAFVAYAHAIFCSRAEFDSFYGPLHLKSSYDSLRHEVSRRYFEGSRDFDAASVIRFAKKYGKTEFYESGQGFYGDPH